MLQFEYCGGQALRAANVGAVTPGCVMIMPDKAGDIGVYQN